MTDIAGRALRGIEAAAYVIHHAMEAYAVAGGEGARRLATALEALHAAPASGSTGLANAGASGPARLEGIGLDAARAAIGSAAAGRRTALLVSGEAAADVLPAVREIVRLGLPVLLVVPSHGADVGATWPSPEPADLAVLGTLPLGALVAGDAGQVAELLLAAQRASVERGAPFAVSFDLGTVGLALSTVTLPEPARITAWATEATPAPGPSGAPSVERTALDALLAPPESAAALEGYRRSTERFEFALNASLRGVERLLRQPVSSVRTDGPTRDADVVVVATGAAARAAAVAASALRAQGARHVAVAQVTALRPFPGAEVVRQAWRARAVVVHEPLPDPLGSGGVLSSAVRASFADALTWHPAFTGIGRIPPVVTVVGSGTSAAAWTEALRTVLDAADPPRVLALAADQSAKGDGAEAHIEALMDDSERENALRFATDWLARRGLRVRAHADGLARATISLPRSSAHADPKHRGASHVLLVCQGAPFDPARVQGLAAGSVTVLAGDHSDRALADTMRAGAARGVRVATLGGHGAAVRSSAALAAVARAIADDDSLDALLAEAATAAFAHDGPAVADEVRAHHQTLRAHLRG